MHRLEKEAFEVLRFDNGNDAYRGALKRTPALVILDVKMPGMDGFEVLERLRKTPSYAAVPIMMLTGMGSEADVVRGFELGADDYLLKPFSPTELLARIRRLVRRGRSLG
jgi:two-component system phosphate regulon response regulator PhoB